MTVGCWLLIGWCVTAGAADIRVPGAADTLADALAIATAGDRILLAPGVHPAGNLMLVDGVTIEGATTDPTRVVIQAESGQRALRAHGIQRADLISLTISGGRATGTTNYDASGGGLMISNANVWLSRVHFVGNHAEGGGGAVQVLYGEVYASNCLFSQNEATRGGGAIDLSHDSNATITRSTFRANRAAWGGGLSVRTMSSCWVAETFFIANSATPPQEIGGAFFSDYAAIVNFSSSVFHANAARRGGAARLNGAETTFLNCTVDGNEAWLDGAGFQARNSTINIVRSIVSNNEGPGLSSDNSQIICVGTNVFGNTGGDWVEGLAGMRHLDFNMEADPRFCAPGDLHIAEDSPCAPANNPVGLIGALPVGCENVGVLLLSFEAVRRREVVQLTWTAADPAVEFRLEGRSLDDTSLPPWTVPYSVVGEGGSFEARDEPKDRDGRLVYSLEARIEDDTWTLLEERIVDPPVPAIDRLTLDQVFPNPFNPQVTITFTLGEAGPVEAAIFDLSGRLVRALTDIRLPAGQSSLTWDGLDTAGRPQPTGTYLLRITGDGAQRSAKLMLVR